ncbi:MAG: Ig-like domain-containing protein [Bacteroidales bacterium]|nr:Ig-like domain-containing protein [Bacteroidales bacterium]
MNKIYPILLGLSIAIFSSCTVKEEVSLDTRELPSFRVYFETPIDGIDTRAYANDQLKIYWNRNDFFSVFTETVSNHKYYYDGLNGSTSGDILPVNGSGGSASGGPLDDPTYNYSIFPYHKYNNCDYDGTLTIPFLDNQDYIPNEKGIGANLIMAAKAEGDLDFMFKHAAGYLGFQLYGSGVSVSSITLRSNNGEFISGYPLVGFDDEDNPLLSFGEDSEGKASCTINYNPAIELGSSSGESKFFWFTLPPTILVRGLTLIVKTSNGGEFTLSSTKSREIKRRVFTKLNPIEVIPEGGTTPDEVPVTGVQLTPSAASVEVGETVSLTATVLPSDATNKVVAWTSTNPSVAAVDNNGNVTGIAAGDATIFVITEEGSFAASSRITVSSSTPEPVTVQSVSLDKTTLDLNVGEDATLVATVLPENADDKTVTWSSSNTAVATVSSTGKVTAVAAGEAVITVTTTNGGKTASCTVTVTNPAVPVQSVSLDKTTLDLNVGENATLVATVLPENADDKTVTWSSNNTAVATVDATGKVTAVAAGEAVITVTTTDGSKTATCTVKVNDKEANHPGDPIGEGEEEQF